MNDFAAKLPPRPMVYATFMDAEGTTVATVYQSGDVLLARGVWGVETIGEMMRWVKAAWRELGVEG